MKKAMPNTNPSSLPTSTGETTPPPDHELVKQIARQINNDAVVLKVDRARHLLPFSNCYWNVARVVQECKGKIVFGWMILWWPKFYAVAVHHAVWRRPDGRLLDVTEPQSADQLSPHTLFVIGEPLSTLDKVPCIDNQFLNFSRLDCVDTRIVIYKRMLAFTRTWAQIAWEAGYRCEYQKAIAAGRNEQIVVPIDKHSPAGIAFRKARNGVEIETAALHEANKRIWIAAASI